MPAVDPQKFFIDGVAFGWRSVLCSVDGIPRRGFRALDWSEKIEREKTHQAIRSGRPLNMTFGEYDVDALTLTMLPQEKQWLKAYLRDKVGSPSSVVRASFVFQIQLAENGYVITSTFNGCKMKTQKGSLKIGPESAETPVDLDCLYVVEKDANGETTMFDDLRDQDGGVGF
ncbi:MAG TPA: hypothetical protein VGH28_10545 [Polyangiaceae bacterium]|jgi:hypothetical protein